MPISVISEPSQVMVGLASTGTESRPYRPYGGSLECFYSRAPILLTAGPAGTGKSRGVLEKLHFCANKWPGMRGLIVRKTRNSLSESGLVTFEEKVLPAGSPIKGSLSRRFRQIYEYPNGSEIVVAGMDDPTKVMSTEFDLIVGLEATEFTEEDVDNLSTRARNNVLPFQQLIMDANPASPLHHLKMKADGGIIKLVESRHEDNPTMWSHKRGTWTEFGRKYLERLDALTGVRKLRLRHGVWAMSEGMVYGEKRSMDYAGSWHCRPV